MSLCADDTAVIIIECDSFKELTEILDEWCTFSGAKFNVEKPEIIPTGTAEYRNKLVETRTVNEKGESIPASIHVTRDKSAMRPLGVWIGNDVNPEGPWRTVEEDHWGDQKGLQEMGDKVPHPGGKATHNTDDNRGKDAIPGESPRDA